ncbi:MAG: hypothetical protein IJT66_03550 [Clostridia bacterium]|nr:hypothetical protein [Clostridia bacterium]
MNTKTKRNTAILAVVITLAAVCMILTVGRVIRNKQEGYAPATWILRSYGNGVALYNGENIAAVYGNIVLDDLPAEDADLLKKGIAFPSREEAERAVEDYDG